MNGSCVGTTSLPSLHPSVTQSQIPYFSYSYIHSCYFVVKLDTFLDCTLDALRAILKDHLLTHPTVITQDVTIVVHLSTFFRRIMHQ